MSESPSLQPQAPPLLDSAPRAHRPPWHQLVARIDPNQYSSLLLPASYRKDSRDLVPAAHNVTACIEKELDLDRLNTVHSWLWVAGLPLPPRALHHQLLLSREIFITEQMDMHLVWTAGRIFLKPIPLFRLEPNFWVEFLTCERQCGFSLDINPWSDFRIAQDKHLLPREVKWPAWRVFVEQLDTEHIHPHIDRRFLHGELRLSRLNKIYALYQTPLRGYMARWDRYDAFFHDNFAGLASLTAYIAVALTAMQVGLATEPLEQNPAFQYASYGFTVFSILGPLIACFLILLLCGSILLQLQHPQETWGIL
ncbi:hypothetical protein BO71DRAFT_425960 [Aspergillus ellipticus CBS 707.79]|uniref:Uncharacterized protein n=1 Tax=Aspergillus ellipticus CBS 707.79 TaxID=1448320 RepID=A0A319DMV1_9EURO|nr:hypothetical protein BO71DRAFT_425960 [Aspergillus ellipticus CBS 707.79]